MAVFSNQATLTYVGGSTVSNVVTGEITENLTVTKTAVNSTYRANDTITYVISIQNEGSTARTGVTLTDDLGAYPFGTGTLTPLSYVDSSLLYYIDGVLQPTPTVTSTSPLTIGGITLPQNGGAILVYRATLSDAAPISAGGSVTNTVTVTGAGIVEPLIASETVTAISEATLSIEKSLFPTTVPEDGVITYTLLISNTGTSPAVATDNLTVSDTFDPILSNITVTLNGEVLSAGTDYTYDETTGLFQTVESRITVPAATVTQDPVTGMFTTTPGTATLVISGTV